MEKVVGFAYHQTPYRYVAKYKDGKWSEGYLTEDANIVLNESACVLQYCQQAFEGMKAYKTVDGRTVCFRPDLNAERMQESCKRVYMPTYPVEDFLKAVDMVVKANEDFIPPYGEGASLYLRPFMIGTDPILGVKSANEFEFRLFASPVGAYFTDPVRPIALSVCDFDRAAPRGTGNCKVGLNYAMSLLAVMNAHDEGYAENLYLDAATRTHLEETGGANIMFIDKEGRIVTPKSDSILPSITKRSIIQVAKDCFGIETVERDIPFSEIDEFPECGVCGTAAVIAPVERINDHGVDHFFDVSASGFGKTFGMLRQRLVDMQNGDYPAPEGWLREIK